MLAECTKKASVDRTDAFFVANKKARPFWTSCCFWLSYCYNRLDELLV